ncbi:glycosyltransferase [Patescibacteria group bacterium]|nr:glycosyltransferase [Patescibacteria group bacterium]
MKKQIDLSLILPCYNEHDVFDGSVTLIIETLERSRWSFEIIFVDDGSKDDTRSKIRLVCRTYDFCHAIIHKDNTGRGAAVNSGIHASQGDVVGYIDIDCEVSPVYISSMVGLIQQGKADVVVGKRMYRSSLTSFIREVLSIGYRRIADILLGTDGIDTESGYKFFHKKKFLPVLGKIRNQHWFWDTESIVLSKRAGLRVVEIPVLFVRRLDKQSTVRIIPDTFSYLKSVWEFFWRFRT